jgi:hypothetical protein
VSTPEWAVTYLSCGDQARGWIGRPGDSFVCAEPGDVTAIGRAAWAQLQVDGDPARE